MRIANIIKKESGLSKPAPAPPGDQKARPKFAQPSARAEKGPSADRESLERELRQKLDREYQDKIKEIESRLKQQDTAREERQKLEKDVRKQFEEEFKNKLKKIEEQTKQFLERTTQADKKHIDEREQEIQRQQKKLEELTQELKKKQDELMRREMEDSLNRQIEAQGRGEDAQKLEQELRDAQKIIKRLESEIKQREKDVREQEARVASQQEEFLKRQKEQDEKLNSRFQKQNEENDKLRKELQELEEKIAKKGRPAPETGAKDEVRPRPQSLPVTRIGGERGPSVPQDVSSGEGTPLRSGAEDLEASPAYLKASQIYEDISRRGRILFDQIRAGKIDSIQGFLKDLEDAVNLALECPNEIIGIVQQPYRMDDYFHYHAANCMLLSLIIGNSMSLSRQELTELAQAAFFHDAGLMDCQEDLNYPKQLNPDVTKEVLRHPEKGAEMLGSWLREGALEAIRQHHETCDGEGYPNRLKGDQITQTAKIVNLVDAFEAMTHKRPYRPQALAVSEAIKELIEKNRGVYDRMAVRALMTCVGLYPVMSMVELSNKQIGRVVKQNRKFPMSPVVRIEFDEWGKKLRRPLMLDLSQSRLIHISGSLGVVEPYQPLQGHHAAHRKKKVSTEILKEFMPVAIAGLLVLLFIYLVVKL